MLMLCWCWADMQRPLKVLELLWDVHIDLRQKKKMHVDYVSKQTLPFCKTRIPHVSKMEATNPKRSMIRRIRVTHLLSLFSHKYLRWEKRVKWKQNTNHKPQNSVYISLQKFSVLFTAAVVHFIDQWSNLKTYYLDTWPENESMNPYWFKRWVILYFSNFKIFILASLLQDDLVNLEICSFK